MAKKKKNRYGNPAKNIAAQEVKMQAAAPTEQPRAKAYASAPEDSSKPMILRILVLAIVAVMILGIVVGAVLF